MSLINTNPSVQEEAPSGLGNVEEVVFESDLQTGQYFDLEKSLVSISLEFGQLLLPTSALIAVERTLGMGEWSESWQSVRPQSSLIRSQSTHFPVRYAFVLAYFSLNGSGLEAFLAMKHGITPASLDFLSSRAQALAKAITDWSSKWWCECLDCHYRWSRWLLDT